MDVAPFLTHIQGFLTAKFLDSHGKAMLSMHATMKSELSVLFVQKVCFYIPKSIELCEKIFMFNFSATKLWLQGN